MLALHLPPEIESRLDALARRTGRSQGDFAREAILEHIEDLEDLYLSKQRLDDLLAGKSETISLADVMNRYGVED